MSTFESFRIAHLPPYKIGAIQQEVLALRSQGREVIDLSHVNPDTGPPAKAVDKLVQCVLQSHNHRYSSSRGITRLREAATNWYARRYGVELDAEREVVVTMGTKEGLAHLLLAILNPGDNVIIPSPSYPIHVSSVFIAGGACIGVPLFSAEEIDSHGDRALVLNEEADGFFRRLEELCQHTWPKPRALICSFPHNPTTTVVTQGFFRRLVEFARDHQLLVIHDAAYSEVVFSEDHGPSLLQIKGATDHCVEFFSFSKNFGVPGWRLGFAVGNPAMISALKKIKSYVDSGMFQPLQIAAIDALRDADAITREMREMYRQRRDVCVDGLRAQGWSVFKPKGTVFVWGRVPETLRERKHPSSELCRALLHESEPGVAVTPGEFFDPQASEFVRFALVENESTLRRALQSLKAVSATFAAFVGFTLSTLIPLDSASADADCAAAAVELNKGVQLSDGSGAEEGLYRKATQLCPKLPEAHFNLALNLLRQSRRDEAITALRTAIQLRPDPAFQIALGTALASNNDLEGAEKEYRRALGSASDSADAHAGLAAISERQGKLDQAEDSLRSAIQLAPNDGLHYLNLGIVLEKLGRTDEAITSLQTAISKRADLVPAYVHLGQLFVKKDELGKAEPHLMKALYLDDKNPIAHVAMGSWLEAKHQFVEARKEFERAAALDPKSDPALVNLGIVLIELGDDESGIEKLQEVLKRSPKNSRALGALGWQKLKAGELDEAERYLQQAIELDGRNALALNNLGIIAERRDNPDRARELYQQARAIDPNLASARENESRLGTP